MIHEVVRSTKPTSVLPHVRAPWQIQPADVLEPATRHRGLPIQRREFRRSITA